MNLVLRRPPAVPPIAKDKRNNNNKKITFLQRKFNRRELA